MPADAVHRRGHGGEIPARGQLTRLELGRRSFRIVGSARRPQVGGGWQLVDADAGDPAASGAPADHDRRDEQQARGGRVVRELRLPSATNPVPGVPSGSTTRARAATSRQPAAASVSLLGPVNSTGGHSPDRRVRTRGASRAAAPTHRADGSADRRRPGAAFRHSARGTGARVGSRHQFTGAPPHARPRTGTTVGDSSRLERWRRRI